MRVLVTGGAGFIASHLLELMAGLGMDAVGLDNFSSSCLKPGEMPFSCLKCDVRSSELKAVFAEGGFDVVFHLAAQTLVPYSLEHPQEDCDINLMGLLNVLECCRAYGVGRLVFASSAAVYGASGDLPLRETAKAEPSSFYGLTKLASESYLRLYHELYGLRTTALRFANVYGERQGASGEAGVVSIFSRRVARGEGVTVYGDGEQSRDWLYAKDAAEALLRAAALDGYNVINVSTGRETTVNRMLGLLEKASRREIAVTYAGKRKGDIARSCLANDRCQNLLGFAPSTSIEEGLERTYNYFLAREAERA